MKNFAIFTLVCCSLLLTLSAGGIRTALLAQNEANESDSVAEISGETNSDGQTNGSAKIDTDDAVLPTPATQLETSKTIKHGKQEFSPLEFLQKCRAQLVRFQSIKAEIRQVVNIGGSRCILRGKYTQGTHLKLRVEFEIKAGELTGTLLEVCDGQVLWTKRNLGDDQPELTRRDVREILRTTAANQTPQNLLLGELGLGGLPALLASLERGMTFNNSTSRTVDGISLVVIEGRWNAAWEKLWKENGLRNSPQQPLPEYLPDAVRIYIDQQHLFPHRIQYLKFLGDTGQLTSMATVDFVNVVRNAKLDERLFEFVPPDGIIPTDTTNKYLQQLQKPKPPQPANQ